ncbi:MAG: flp pilus-assembly TadE/G-like family protein [Actinomycetota bacterium]|nr:flp pilus-assembly TadE/G-like family protein [Actinomycetota bacterium]
MPTLAQTKTTAVEVSRERGSASLWVLSLVLILWAAGALVMAAGVVLAARHQAGGAADLAALAGADRVLSGPDTACGAAARVAQRNRARLTQCRVLGTEIEVLVQVDTPDFLGQVPPATGRARAGPAPPDGPGDR